MQNMPVTVTLRCQSYQIGKGQASLVNMWQLSFWIKLISKNFSRLHKHPSNDWNITPKINQHEYSVSHWRQLSMNIQHQYIILKADWVSVRSSLAVAYVRHSICKILHIKNFGWTTSEPLSICCNATLAWSRASWQSWIIVNATEQCFVWNFDQVGKY